jgi:uncharacterized protein YciI
MKYHVFKLIAPRATFMADITPEERALMGQHLAYWKAMMAAGTVVVFGPVLDPTGPYGLGVVRLEDGADPSAVAAGDPVIRAQRGFRYDVAPMANAIVPG